MSCLRMSPVTASYRMGVPQRMMATHAGSTGKSFPKKNEITSDMPANVTKSAVRFRSSVRNSTIAFFFSMNTLRITGF